MSPLADFELALPELAEGDVVFAAVPYQAQPMRLTVETVVGLVEGKRRYHDTVTGVDADGSRHFARLGEVTKLHDVRDLDAERLRRLHELATEETARLYIALRTLLDASDAYRAGTGPNIDVLDAITAAREALSLGEPEVAS